MLGAILIANGEWLQTAAKIEQWHLNIHYLKCSITTRKESEAPLGFYVVFTDTEGRPSPPEVVSDVTIRPFLSRRQTDQMEGDNMPALSEFRRQPLFLIAP